MQFLPQEIAAERALRKLPKDPPLEDSPLIPTIRHPEGISKDKMFFSEETVSSLVREYRKTGSIEVWQKIILESIDLIDAIIKDGRFHLYDEIDALRNECIVKLSYAISRWNPDRGKCYTLFSVSIKRFLYTYSQRALRRSQLLSSFNPTDIEQTISGGSTQAPSYELQVDLRSKVLGIQTRFVAREQKQALLFLVEHFLEGDSDTDKREVAKEVSRQFKVKPWQAELFYSYTLIKVRSALYDLYSPGLANADIIRGQKRWTNLPELADIVGAELFTKLCTIFAGMSIRFFIGVAFQMLEMRLLLLSEDKAHRAKRVRVAGNRRTLKLECVGLELFARCMNVAHAILSGPRARVTFARCLWELT
jgi:hypothetical protein